MAITMQGNWTISVKGKNAAFPQRFLVSGAASGNGTYEGKTTTPPVTVTGAHWSIRIENDPGTGFVDSEDRITFPSVSAGNVRFDIQSNDAGPDLDFNDLVLTCSTPQTATDFFVYGRVSWYSGRCIFNPCSPYPWLVLDRAQAIEEALAHPSVADALTKLYPDITLVPKPVIGPQPPPPPPPPYILPLGEQAALPSRLMQVLRVKEAPVEALKTRDSSASATPAEATSVSFLRTFERDSVAATAGLAVDKITIGSIVDHLRPLCESGELPGVVLRFEEYDRTTAELSGGPYTGTGPRETLGVCATDTEGNYIFRFSRTIAEFINEATVDVAAGENAVVQSMPDVLVQLLDPMQPTGVCYESAPYWNVPLLKRIDICVPKDCIGHLPTACQGSYAIQAIGDIFIGAPTGPHPPGQPNGYGARVGFSNSLGAAGRITAKNSLPDVPQARCAAWAGRLDFFACFVDHPEVKWYTIRFRPHGTLSWQFFQEPYTHPQVAKVGIPGYSGDPVGPFDHPLHIDGGPLVSAKAYHNIESDPVWVLTHRDRKAVISSWLYAPIPGPVDFLIEGYDDPAGNKIAAAEDVVTLFIDNNGPDFAIQSVTMPDPDGVLPDQLGGVCALFTVPGVHPDAPLKVTFKANESFRFLNRYDLGVRKGNSGSFPISGLGPGQISGLYVHGDDLVCSSFEGTFDDPTHDAQGYVVAEVKPASGNWLASGQTFCTFAVQLSCSIRVTNGYNQAVYGYGPTEYLLGIQL
jgi:hypothetical protein